jgi:hypothetical protein
MSGTVQGQVDHTGLLAFLKTCSVGSVLAWTTLLVSALLPWFVAIAVKLHLDAQGEPTWDWLYFLHPTSILYELWATLWFALPGISVALLCYPLFSNRHIFFHRLNAVEKAVIILPSLVIGAFGSIPVFIDTFWEFHPIVLMLPFFITILYTGHYVLGLGVGLTLALGSNWIRRGFRRDRAF